MKKLITWKATRPLIRVFCASASSFSRFSWLLLISWKWLRIWLAALPSSAGFDFTRVCICSSLTNFGKLFYRFLSDWMLAFALFEIARKSWRSLNLLTISWTFDKISSWHMDWK